MLALPLVCVAAFFLLDPLSRRLGAPSLMRDWQRGGPGQRRSLFHGPRALWAVVGVAESGLQHPLWVYALPWLNQPKLFAMPLAGYLGFPPFALKCYVASLSLLRGGQDGDHQGRPRAPIAPVWRQALLVLYLMDQRVVKIFGG